MASAGGRPTRSTAQLTEHRQAMATATAAHGEEEKQKKEMETDKSRAPNTPGSQGPTWVKGAERRRGTGTSLGPCP